MTTLNRATKTMLTTFAFAGLVAFSSCSKDDDNTTVNPDATVKIVNVLPDAGAVNVYNGESKLNSTNIGFGEATGYLSVAKGDATFDFKGTLNGNTVLSVPVKFVNGTYSLFATGKTSDNTTTGVLVKDDFGNTVEGKAKIRFVHVSPNAPTVNFLLNDSLLNSGAAFKTATDFKEMAAGTYTVKLNDATSGTTVISKSDVVLQAGKVYTVVAEGLVNATPVVEQSFQLNVLANN
jgi:hypothetical protein